MGDFKLTPAAIKRLDAQRIISGDAGLSSSDRAEAKDLLHKAAVDLVNRDGTVKSGYVTFKTDREGQAGLSTSMRKKGDAAVAFAKTFRQLVSNAYGDKPGVLDAVDRYLGEQKISRGLGTQSLVGMVRLLEKLDGVIPQDALAQARVSKGRLNAANFEGAFNLSQMRSNVRSLGRDAAAWNSPDPSKSREFRLMLETNFDRVHIRLQATESPPGPQEKAALLHMSRVLQDAMAVVQLRELDPMGLSLGLDKQLPSPALPGAPDAQAAVHAPSEEDLFKAVDQFGRLARNLMARETELHQSLQRWGQDRPPGTARSTEQAIAEQHLNTVRMAARPLLEAATKALKAFESALSPISISELDTLAKRQRHDQVAATYEVVKTLNTLVASLPNAKNAPTKEPLQELLRGFNNRTGEASEHLKRLAVNSAFTLQDEAAQSRPELERLQQAQSALQARFDQLDLRKEAALEAMVAQGAGPEALQALQPDEADLEAQRTQLQDQFLAVFDAQRKAVTAQAQAINDALIEEEGKPKVNDALNQQLARCDEVRTKTVEAMRAMRSQVAAPDEKHAQHAQWVRASDWAALAASLKGGLARPEPESLALKLRALGLAKNPQALKGLLSEWTTAQRKDREDACRQDADVAAKLLRAAVAPPRREVGSPELQVVRQVWRAMGQDRPLISGFLGTALAREMTPAKIDCAPDEVSPWLEGAMAHHYARQPGRVASSPLMAPNALVRLSAVQRLTMQGADLSGALLVVEADRVNHGSQIGAYSLKGANLTNCDIVINTDESDKNVQRVLLSYQNPTSFRTNYLQGKGKGTKIDDHALTATELAIKPHVGLVSLLDSIDSQKFPDQKIAVARQLLTAALAWHSVENNHQVLKQSPLLEVVRGDPVLTADKQVSKLIREAVEQLEDDAERAEEQ